MVNVSHLGGLKGCHFAWIQHKEGKLLGSGLDALAGVTVVAEQQKTKYQQRLGQQQQPKGPADWVKSESSVAHKQGLRQGGEGRNGSTTAQMAGVGRATLEQGPKTGKREGQKQGVDEKNSRRTQMGEEFVLLDFALEAVGRGDGGTHGGNALASGAVGTTVMYVAWPEGGQSSDSMLAVTLRGLTLRAQGGRMDWVFAAKEWVDLATGKSQIALSNCSASVEGTGGKATQGEELRRMGEAVSEAASMAAKAAAQSCMHGRKVKGDEADGTGPAVSLSVKSNCSHSAASATVAAIAASAVAATGREGASCDRESARLSAGVPSTRHETAAKSPRRDARPGNSCLGNPPSMPPTVNRPITPSLALPPGVNHQMTGGISTSAPSHAVGLMETDRDSKRKGGSIYCLLDLYDVVVAYEPGLEALGAEGTAQGSPVACCLAMAAMRLGGDIISGSPAACFRLWLRDAALNVADMGMRAARGASGGSYSRAGLQKAAYVPVAKESVMEARIFMHEREQPSPAPSQQTSVGASEEQKGSASSWEFRCANSLISLDVCRDSAAAVGRLGAQLGLLVEREIPPGPPSQGAPSEGEDRKGRGGHQGAGEATRQGMREDLRQGNVAVPANVLAGVHLRTMPPPQPASSPRQHYPVSPDVFVSASASRDLLREKVRGTSFEAEGRSILGSSSTSAPQSDLIRSSRSSVSHTPSPLFQDPPFTLLPASSQEVPSSLHASLSSLSAPPVLLNSRGVSCGLGAMTESVPVSASMSSEHTRSYQPERVTARLLAHNTVQAGFIPLLQNGHLTKTSVHSARSSVRSHQTPSSFDSAVPVPSPPASASRSSVDYFSFLQELLEVPGPSPSVSRSSLLNPTSLDTSLQPVNDMSALPSPAFGLDSPPEVSHTALAGPGFSAKESRESQLPDSLYPFVVSDSQHLSKSRLDLLSNPGDQASENFSATDSTAPTYSNGRFLASGEVGPNRSDSSQLTMRASRTGRDSPGVNSSGRCRTVGPGPAVEAFLASSSSTPSSNPSLTPSPNPSSSRAPSLQSQEMPILLPHRLPNGAGPPHQSSGSSLVRKLNSIHSSSAGTLASPFHGTPTTSSRSSNVPAAKSPPGEHSHGRRSTSVNSHHHVQKQTDKQSRSSYEGPHEEMNPQQNRHGEGRQREPTAAWYGLSSPLLLHENHVPSPVPSPVSYLNSPLSTTTPSKHIPSPVGIQSQNSSSKGSANGTLPPVLRIPSTQAQSTRQTSPSKGQKRLPKKYPPSQVRIHLTEASVHLRLHAGTDWPKKIDGSFESRAAVSTWAFSPGRSQTARAAPGRGQQQQQQRNPKSAVAAGSLADSRGCSCLEVRLSGMEVQEDLFGEGTAHASRLWLAITDMGVYDRSPSARWPMVMGYSSSASRPRDEGSRAVRVLFEAVRPEPTSMLEELRLSIALLPIRIHLDQSHVEFLTEFSSANGSATAANEIKTPGVGPLEELRDESKKGSAGDGGKEDWVRVSARRLSPNCSVAEVTVEEPVQLPEPVEPPMPFIQFFEVHPFVICVDYVPRSVDLSALSKGSCMQLVNLVRWKGVEVHLKGVRATGLQGWGGLGSAVAGEWIADISQNQKHKFVRGVGPISPLCALAFSAAQLILLPVEQYRRDRRIFKGMRKGAAVFLRSLSVEALDLTTHLADLTHRLLHKAELSLAAPVPLPLSALYPSPSPSPSVQHALPSSHPLSFSSSSSSSSSPSSHSSSSRHRTAKTPAKSPAYSQPADLREGLEQACETFENGLMRAAAGLLTNPAKVYYQTGAGGEGGGGGALGRALVTALRAAPAATVAPAAATAEAVQRALMGMRNGLDPERKRASDEKHREPKPREGASPINGQQEQEQREHGRGRGGLAPQLPLPPDWAFGEEHEEEEPGEVRWDEEGWVADDRVVF
eukprot:TRINITY_DN13626_c1_g1_i1.p1 TRINITY_DN13626_c1_g1~~TRINITY_DN13626_c1_g1_i1.p1  ORF type:complete len:2005 (+),score=324.78 TRINITY_DN13626_c1_g1_i1:311-6016(+)